MFLLYSLYIQFLLAFFTYGFVTESSSHSLKDARNSERNKMNLEEFNALDDLSGMTQNIPVLAKEDSFLNDSPLQVNNKKSNSKPKYDPAWKFMGLGKRPHSHRKEISTYDSSHEYDQSEYYDNGFSDDFDYSSANIPKEEVNPLLTFSTLISFQIVNAIKDGIAEATKKAAKSAANLPVSKLYSRDHGSEKLGNPVGAYGGRQKAMYDPGWKLTGLGRR